MQAAIKKNIAIVCNPLAGNGRAVILAEKIVSELSARNIENRIFKENWPADLNGFTDIFIVGGDGTLNYFINHYPDINIPLVIFKGGTGNDVHWLLYGKKSFDEQLGTALAAAPRAIDAGKCNERLFINGVGIGFDGAVAKALTGKKKLPGKTSFLITILKKIFFYRSGTYNISAAGLKQTTRKLMIGVANGRRAGGGFQIAPAAVADDGWFDAVLIDAISPLKRLKYLPVIEKGKHLELSFIHYFKTKKILIESDELMEAHLDGEYYSDKKMEIEILPGKFLFRY
jgi:YegS/Rv2252/BmrU family lipid kinase